MKPTHTKPSCFRTCLKTGKGSEDDSVARASVKQSKTRTLEFKHGDRDKPRDRQAGRQTESVERERERERERAF